MTTTKNPFHYRWFFLLCLLVAPLTPVAAGSLFSDITLSSPLPFTTIEELVIAILNALIVIAVPLVVLMIIYSGFLYVTARGNAEQTKTASRALTYAVIGGILIIGAVAITAIMEEAISEFQATTLAPHLTDRSV